MTPGSSTQSAPHPHADTWVTADGFLPQDPLPNDCHDDARGNRKDACTCSYTVTGNRPDDTGFTATGDVRDGVLYDEYLFLCPDDSLPEITRKLP
ncbi:Atu4866 domain-containing protein [Streptomyces sp. 142MFCol3.1]|uniref:Atu4866 domain-containing protein n=1 Tax=Streptomyces sp. 142MFCol3.1 TaxID=1172179 RepID=UPI0006856E0D|nr:Atu4866 domain-containing protein [Streptomyces sp. 142MFCol3.1]